jgi:hypothetical protein
VIARMTAKTTTAVVLIVAKTIIGLAPRSW